MTPEEYRTNRKRTSNTSLTYDDQMLNCALGLGEAGELQGLIKKHIYHGHPLDMEMLTHMLKEAGDIYFYLDWLAELLGVTPGKIMELNVEKLAKRYPNGFSSTDSINRSE